MRIEGCDRAPVMTRASSPALLAASAKCDDDVCLEFTLTGSKGNGSMRAQMRFLNSEWQVSDIQLDN